VPATPALDQRVLDQQVLDGELQRALAGTASALEAVATERARLARQARQGWVGALRSRFDAERATRDATTADLATRCRALAVRLAIGTS
jgi:hypothetical protein